MRKLTVALALVLAGCRSKPTNVFIDPALATMVPSDTVFLAGIRLDKLRETPAYKRFVDRPVKTLDDFQKETGLDPRKDLWEFLVVGNGKQTLVFCRGKFTEFGLEPKLSRPGIQRMSYKGMLMLGNEETAVLFANASVAVAGPTPQLRALVDNRDNSSNGIPGWLQQKVNTVPPGSQVWAAGDVSRTLGALNVQDNGTAGNFAQFAPNIDTATIGLDFSDGMKMSAVALCKTDNDANRLSSTIRAAVGFVRLSTPTEEPQLLTALDGIRSEVKDGRTVMLGANLNAVQFDKLMTFVESRRRK